MKFFEVIGTGLCKEVSAPIYGRQDIGYSPGGPIDRFSMQTGNIMLGNADFATALEIVFVPVIEFKQNCLFILTGAKCKNSSLQKKSSDYQTSITVPHATIAYAQEGDRITLGETQYGFRTYLCFAPCDNDKAPGSRRSVLGQTRPPYDEISTFADPENRIRVIEGPEHRYLEDSSTFLKQPWLTTSEMSDMGIRLSCLSHEQPAVKLENMVSQPVNDGTIQLTPKGPIVLLRMRQTIGGYPRISNVIGPDVDLLGQYGPNQVIRFREVSLEESLNIARKEKQDLDRFRLRWAPRDRTEEKRARSPVRKTKKKKAG